MEVTLNIADQITPALARLASDVQKTDLMEAAGLALLSLTRSNFQTAEHRPTAWPARTSGGSHALLKLSGTLWRSIALTSVTPSSASVTSDRPYAAIHQFGGTITPKTAGGSLKFQLPGGQWITKKTVTIPARPFFPILNGKLTPRATTRIAKAIDLKLQSLADRASRP